MNKQKEIRKFIVRDRDLVHSPTVQYLTNEHLTSVVLENNDSFEIMRDHKEMGTVIYCKNKPRNMLVYGVAWEEMMVGYRKTIPLIEEEKK